MAVNKNLRNWEIILRLILGIMLIPLGFYVSGFWKPLSILIGVLFIITAFVGY